MSKKNKEHERSKEAVIAQPQTSAEQLDNPEQPKKLSNKDYRRELAKLHVQLVHLQDWVRHTRMKICIVLEGRDGAGKGGVIKAITDRVSPRTFHVIALAAPTDYEKSQLYLQRYIRHLPGGGDVNIFDRSWYNRAGVERVMGFCSEEEAKYFLEGTPQFEKMIVNSGTILLKYWMEVSMEEQSRRLEGRINDGRKTWKLSPMDLESYSRWYDYSRARDAMFAATDTPWAPWFVVNADDKKRARLNVIRHLLDQIPYKELPRDKVKLPKRQKPGDYQESHYPFKRIAEHY